MWLCYMNYFIGPKVHKKLDGTSIENYYNSLINHLRNTQFFDRTKYAIPEVRVLKNEKTGDVKETVTFYPHGSQFLQIAESVMFMNLKTQTLTEVPYSFIKKIKHDKINLIDEVQFTVDELTEEEYDGILNSVKKIVNYVNRKNEAPKKNITKTNNTNTKKRKDVKWWEFWKK